MPNVLKSWVANFIVEIQGIPNQIISVKIETAEPYCTASGLSNGWHLLGEFDGVGTQLSTGPGVGLLPPDGLQLIRHLINDAQEHKAGIAVLPLAPASAEVPT